MAKKAPRQGAGLFSIASKVPIQEARRQNRAHQGSFHKYPESVLRLFPSSSDLRISSTEVTFLWLIPVMIKPSETEVWFFKSPLPSSLIFTPPSIPRFSAALFIQLFKGGSKNIDNVHLFFGGQFMFSFLIRKCHLEGHALPLRSTVMATSSPGLCLPTCSIRSEDFMHRSIVDLGNHVPGQECLLPQLHSCHQTIHIAAFAAL